MGWLCLPLWSIRCTLPSWAGEEELWMGWGRLCPAGRSTPYTHLGIFQPPHPRPQLLLGAGPSCWGSEPPPLINGWRWGPTQSGTQINLNYSDLVTAALASPTELGFHHRELSRESSASMFSAGVEWGAGWGSGAPGSPVFISTIKLVHTS